MSKLNEMYKTFESSTRYYYFTDEILDVMDNNHNAQEWFSDWIYSEGPGSDERYVPDDTPQDYINKDTLYASEIAKVTKYFETKKWSKANEEKSPKPKYAIGTLITITNYGSVTEPQKSMWNGARAEIRGISSDGNYNISITDIKGSEVMFSKKWVGREADALKQRFTLEPSMFKTNDEIEAEAK